jgi:hypothetical protein
MADLESEGAANLGSGVTNRHHLNFPGATQALLQREIARAGGNGSFAFGSAQAD